MSRERTSVKKTWLSIIILTVFMLALIGCAGTLRSILLKNTNTMGSMLVKNYSSVEEKNIETCEAILEIGTNYIAKREQTDPSLEGLYPFMDGLTGVYGSGSVRIYGGALGNEMLITDSPEIRALTEYDVTAAQWYRGAVSANGETYISPVYTDAVTGLPIVTMCRCVPQTGSFLAIDIMPSHFEMNSRDIVLPAVSSYFLVDAEGNLLYYLSSWDYNREAFQTLVDGYRESAACELTDHVSENVKGSDGIVRNVFFHHMDNGWTGILTIPRSEIFSDAKLFQTVIFILVGIGVILIGLQLIREHRNRKREAEYLVYQKAMSSTARACRAIYYVDIDKRMIEKVYPLGADGKPRRSTYESEVSGQFRQGVVAAEHTELVAGFLDMDNIVKSLAERDHIELQFKRRRSDIPAEEHEGEDYEWCSISVTVAEKQNGKLSAITMAVRSIDDVIKREEEQKQMLSLAVARAEAANHAKSDFLSRMSHDIRTPMNAILGMTSIAALHIDEKKRVLDALEKITVSGRHLLGLINDVLDMSKIESGKVSLTEDAFNLSDTIDKLLTVFRPQTDAKQQTLEVHIARIEHEAVIGDEQHLSQIFMNILGNAVKFTPPGGSISLQVAEKQSRISGSGYYEFTFEDTGIGMEPEYIEKIFEPFSRAANSSGNKIEGTGLGMSIAVNIAHMMDGDIKVESELGKGSKFTVMVHLKLDDFVPETMEALSALPVLVVDDEQDACESACEILCSLGMDAEYVLDGDSAIERMLEAEQAHAEFSVVILDWKMPGKDGFETAKEIRSTIGGDVPIIILSAYDWTDIEAEAQQAGIDAFISKPMFKSKLVRVLHNVLGDKREEAGETTLEAFRQQNYSGRRVLLVEDNEINTEVAKELLHIVGIQVETALNGQLAVDRLLETEPGHFDLIFMDIQMPVMNGYEAVRAIRASGRRDLQEIPIVAMTADAFLDDIRKAKDAGMNDHISKPVDLDRLEAVLQKWVTEDKP